MERKFLIFSCLVLLSSIVYFIYTSYQLHIENKNQQEVVAELEVPAVERVYTNNFSHVKPGRSNLGPIEEKWEAFEEVFSDFEELEEMTETSQLEGVAETAAVAADEDRTGISPELEAMFLDVNALVKRDNAILDEMEPHVQQALEISRKIGEIADRLVEAERDNKIKKKLYAEVEGLYRDDEAILAILKPYIQQRRQLRADFEQKNSPINTTKFIGYGSKDDRTLKTSICSEFSLRTPTGFRV